MRLLAGRVQRFEQEEDFGGHRVVQIRGVGEGAVTAAGDDGLESLDEKKVPPGGERAKIGDIAGLIRASVNNW